MKKLLLAALVALGLSGCVVHDSPYYYSAYDVPPGDVVYVEPGVYYRTVIIGGYVHREYYRWHPRYGWHYQHRMRVR